MPEQLPSISVIVVTWNGWHHLEQCLPSLLAQDYPADLLEILVVDNGSADGTVQKLTGKFPQVKLLANESNRGFAEPNNQAAARAQGQYLALINNDMRADPQWLRKAADRLDEPSGTVCVACKILSWDGTTVDFHGGSLQYQGYADQLDIGRKSADIEDKAMDLLFACGGAMLIRRDVFLELGGFDADYFALYEDVDLGWRLWLRGYRVIYAPESKVYHRLHGTLSRSREEKMRYLMHRNALFTIFKNYNEENFQKILPLAFIAAVRRALYFSGADRSSFYLWAGQDAQRGQQEAIPESILRQSREVINHLVVCNDLLDALPALLEKRGRIQSRRLRKDEELFSLFRDPFRAIVVDWDYQETELQSIERLGLTSVFRDFRQDLVAGEEEHYLAGRKRCECLQWQIGQLERHKKELELQLMELTESIATLGGMQKPVQTGSPRNRSVLNLTSEFCRHWRQTGWREALHQTRRFFRKQKGNI